MLYRIIMFKELASDNLFQIYQWVYGWLSIKLLMQEKQFTEHLVLSENFQNRSSWMVALPAKFQDRN